METAQARAEAALRRDVTLEAVAFAAQSFLQDPDWARGIDRVLRRLGEAARISRAYLLENGRTPQGLRARPRAIWSAATAPGHGDPGGAFELGGFERWIRILGRGDLLHGPVSDFPESERRSLTDREVRSILLAPVRVGGGWWGSLGFDDCEDERLWSQVEIDMLRAAADTLGAAIARARSEQYLRDAESRYRHLVERVPAISYVDVEDLDTETWPTRYISPQCESILGYSPSEWMRDPGLWLRLLHPDDRDNALAADARHYGTGEPLHSEYRLIARDGREVWVRDQASIVVDPDGVRTSQGVLIDVTESRRAEEERREAEARYRSIVEQTPAITYQEFASTGSGEHGAVYYMSPQVERILGYPAERWWRTPDFWTSVIHPDDLERVTAESDRVARTGEAYAQEYRMTSADGRVVWFRDEAVLIRDDKGQPMFWQGVMLDITDRKRVEQQARDAERRLRDLVENIPAVTYREAIDANPEDFYISPQVETLFGYTPREWTWTPGFWRDHVHPEDVDRVVELDRVANETGEPFEAEYRLRRADGEYVWIQDQATLIGPDDGERFWQGFLLDVTERREAEAAVSEAETRYRALVEQVPAIIYTQAVDPRDPTITNTTYIGPRHEALLGYTVEEALETGGLWREILHPDDRERVLAADAAGNETGEDFSMEYRMVAKDGSVVWVHDEATVVRDDEGRPRFWQGFLLDISERKLAEERLERALDVEREATQRLRTLDEMKNTFLQAVSHDLRTPLAAILGLAITLERAEVDLSAEDSRDLARRIATNARKLDRMVTDLLDLDRLGRGIVQPKRRPTDVGALVARVAADSDLTAQGRLTLEAPEAIADVDASKIERIVENLLANTARHTPAGTTVWVRVEALERGVLLVVEDQGPGVPEELRETIFQPFSQGPGLSEHSPGVGIGLSLVLRFAQLHDGRAWVEERPGGGASFRVFLPRSAAAGSSLAETEGTGSANAPV